MVHFSHANHKGANEIETSFLTATAGQLVLRRCVWPRDFGYRTEEEMGAIGKPVDLCSILVSLTIQALMSVCKEPEEGVPISIQ